MAIERKRYSLLENAGASPSFSTSYHSCNQHRKISIGLTVQEALSGIGSVTKMKDGTGASRIKNIVGDKKTQEDLGRLSLKNGQEETKIQKSGAWVSRAFHKKGKSIEVYANRSSFFQSENGISKKVDCVTYSRKSKNNFGPDKLEEFAFAATQEMHVAHKREIKNKIVREEDGKSQTNQCTESLRTKLWDILQSAPSQAENKAAIAKPGQNSDSIETDSEKPIPTACRPVTCSILERNITNNFPSKQQKPKIGHLPPCVQQKIPEQSVFRFTGEEGRMCASGMNRNSSIFKRKSKRKHSLIAPRRIQYSPEPIFEGKPEENQKNEKLQSPLLPPQETTKPESLKNPLLVTSANEGVLSFPMVTKEKEKAQTDLPKTLPRQSINDKVVEGTPFHQYDANLVQNSPVPNNAAVEEENIHRSSKGVVKEKLQISATKDKGSLSTRRSPKHSFDAVKNLPLTNGAKEEIGFCQSWKHDTEKLQIGATETEKFQNPQKSTIHKHVGVLGNLAILKDRDVEEGSCNRSWKCDLNKEKLQIGTKKENRFRIPQGSPMHGTRVELENSPVLNDAAVEEGGLCKYEVDKENLQTGLPREKSSHSPPLCAANLCLDSPEPPENMTVSGGFFRHRRHSHACVASSDDTTGNRKIFSETPPVFHKNDVENNSSSTHRSCKGVVKEQQIIATNDKGQRSPNHRFDAVKNLPLPNGAMEESGFCQSRKRDTEKLQIDATENEKFQYPQKSTIHKHVGVFGNLAILKDRDVKEGSCNRSWECDLNKEKLQIGTKKENRFHIPQGSPMHGTDVELENSPVPNDAAVGKGGLCRYEVDKENMQTGESKEKSYHSPPLYAADISLDSPEPPENMTISGGFFHHRRHSHACVASSDDTTENRKLFFETPSVFQKKDVENNSFPSSFEMQNDKCSGHHITKGEKWTSKRHQKRRLVLHRSMRAHAGVKIDEAPSTVLPSMKGEENSQSDVGSQHSEDALARAIAKFASGLARFKIRMKSHTQGKTSEILSVTIDKIQAQLQSVDSQIHTEMNKFISLSNSKRRRLETRFQGQQERLQTIQAKFMEEMNVQLQECKNVLREIEADQMELRAISERQEASHRKLLLQVGEEIQAQLEDAEKRIATLHKEAGRKMQELKRALSGAV